MHKPKFFRTKSRPASKHRAEVVAVINAASVKEQQRLARREAKMLKKLGRDVEAIEEIQNKIEALQAS